MPKAPKPITAYGFKGMNNLPDQPGKLLDDKRQITPQVVLNCVVADGGTLSPREGYAAHSTIPGMHSLAGEGQGLSVMLGVGVADSILYLIGVDGSYLAMDTVDGPRSRLSYAEVNGLVYMSNPYWSGVYDPQSGVVRPWGIATPPVPDIALTDGDMPPGKYVLAYTRTTYSKLSGNGPLATVSWEGGGRAIQVNNLPSDGHCWITHPNGKELFLAEVAAGVITGQVPDMVPLPTFNVIPPPNFTHIAIAHGRAWGARGKNLYYSEPFQYEWFKESNTIPFTEDVVLIASVNEGLFVNSLTDTWGLMGTDPGKMKMGRVGNGAVPGTLIYAPMPANLAAGAATSMVFATLSQMPTPTWLSPTGFVVGTHTGHLTHITERRLKMVPRNQGASYYQIKDGIPRIVSTVWGSPLGTPDSEIRNMILDGKLFE